MKWYENAVFYHIYPLGLTDAPKNNDYQITEHRLNQLGPWIKHIKEISCNALYIGPLFESVGHGYETTDYYKLDSRLGDNEDLKKFIQDCHYHGIHVIFDGVFNHTGRDFFAFKDIQQNREGSQYRDWYCNVNFQGNNEYNDGFSYDNWGGYNLLAKLNLQNPKVRNYLLDVVRYWVKEFDIDGIRLDAADVLEFTFMHELRLLTKELKEDFWLMGEVIHGDYARWVNPDILHSVTNYQLHKALYSSHNDHNYFELAHTIRYQLDKGDLLDHLYTFVDNHDVERIYTRLSNKQHFLPVHILLFTLPGIPSIYYGSEFAIEGKKQNNTDDNLRPTLDLSQITQTPQTYASMITTLVKIHQTYDVFFNGDYHELLLTNRQYAFSRANNHSQAIIVVNNDEQPVTIHVPANGTYTDVFSGNTQTVKDTLYCELPPTNGMIWIQQDTGEIYAQRMQQISPEEHNLQQKEILVVDHTKPYEDMTVKELQACVLDKLAQNGPVTDQMRRDVQENIYHDSLVNWVKSFR
ncbi:MAG: alpha-amylase family glycosyl hydrolase [Erysipelotrichaceae bacterium]|nr:alpha-amylase family glycosyl hydrolase [Erysipelotrichaceae bacterium]